MKKFIAILLCIITGVLPVSARAAMMDGDAASLIGDGGFYRNVPEINITDDIPTDAKEFSSDSPNTLLSLFSEDGFSEITESQYYGRNALAEMDNGNILVKLYDAYTECIDALESCYTVFYCFDSFNEAYAFLTENIASVHLACENDHPQFFYVEVEPKISLRHSDNKTTVYFEPLIDGSEISATQAKEISENRKMLDKTADNVIENAGINADMTDREKALALHEELLYTTEYDFDAAAVGAPYDTYPTVHTIYGSLVEHKAVCDGYARAYQYLLYKVGILSHIVTGVAYDSAGNAESHAWNIVKLDGSWYHTDITWDDQSSSPYHSYYNVTTDKIESDHDIDESYYPIPECTATIYNYFTDNPYEMTIDSVANQFEESPVATVYAPDLSIDEVYAWYKENIYNVLDKMTNKSGKVFYTITGIGGEYKLILTRYGLTADKNFEVTLKGNNDTSTELLQIFYDENGVVTKTAVTPIELDKDGITVLSLHPSMAEDNYSKVKYLLWDSHSGLTPVFESDTVEYQ